MCPSTFWTTYVGVGIEEYEILYISSVFLNNKNKNSVRKCKCEYLQTMTRHLKSAKFYSQNLISCINVPSSSFESVSAPSFTPSKVKWGLSNLNLFFFLDNVCQVTNNQGKQLNSQFIDMYISLHKADPCLPKPCSV